MILTPEKPKSKIYSENGEDIKKNGHISHSSAKKEKFQKELFSEEKQKNHHNEYL